MDIKVQSLKESVLRVQPWANTQDVKTAIKRMSGETESSQTIAYAGKLLTDCTIVTELDIKTPLTVLIDFTAPPPPVRLLIRRRGGEMEGIWYRCNAMEETLRGVKNRIRNFHGIPEDAIVRLYVDNRQITGDHRELAIFGVRQTCQIDYELEGDRGLCRLLRVRVVSCYGGKTIGVDLPRGATADDLRELILELKSKNELPFEMPPRFVLTFDGVKIKPSTRLSGMDMREGIVIAPNTARRKRRRQSPSDQ